MMVPVRLSRPPKNTMMIQIADWFQPNMAGSTYVVKNAIRAPAYADSPAPSAKTFSLWVKESIPPTWAASSSVRMARQSRPNLERRTLRMSHTATSSDPKASQGVVSCGTPENPMAPPV